MPSDAPSRRLPWLGPSFLALAAAFVVEILEWPMFPGAPTHPIVAPRLAEVLIGPLVGVSVFLFSLGMLLRPGGRALEGVAAGSVALLVGAVVFYLTFTVFSVSYTIGGNTVVVQTFPQSALFFVWGLGVIITVPTMEFIGRRIPSGRGRFAGFQRLPPPPPPLPPPPPASPPSSRASPDQT